MTFYEAMREAMRQCGVSDEEITQRLRDAEAFNLAMPVDAVVKKGREKQAVAKMVDMFQKLQNPKTRQPMSAAIMAEIDRCNSRN